MSARGFSLIEIIVSLFIISILIIASQTILFGTPLTQLAKDQDIALTIARNELESVRSGGYDSVPATGSFSDSLLSSLTSGAGTITVSAYNAKTKHVTVTVTWSERGKSQSVSLDTLVTQTGGLP